MGLSQSKSKRPQQRLVRGKKNKITNIFNGEHPKTRLHEDSCQEYIEKERQKREENK